MRIFITGGSGSLGEMLLSRWASRSDLHLTVLSRDPLRQDALRSKYPFVSFLLKDIETVTSRDVSDIDVVVHCAALKYVGLSELAPIEFLRVNLLGSLAVARAIQASARVRLALLVSTDKAVEPVNTYGMTKALAERVWLSFDSAKTRFVAVRWGNVFDSRGGVLERWLQCRASGEMPEVREPEPTRFVFSRDRAVRFLEEVIRVSARSGVKARLFVPGDLCAVSMWDLARAIFGVESERNWRRVPMLPTEKQHEVLVSQVERPAEWFGREVVGVWRVGVSGERDGRFCSATAPRVGGEEVLRLLGLDGSSNTH